MLQALRIVVATPAGLILGVRPNSPIQTISVDSNNPAVGQIVDQGRPGRIEHLAQLAHRVEIFGVRVPAQRGIAQSAERDLHERHALLNQPPSQQAALAETVAAVGGRAVLPVPRPA